MSSIIDLFTRPLTSHMSDARAGQLICWAGAGVVLVLGVLKLLQLGLNEKEWFFGILLLLAVSLLMMILGFILPMAARQRASEQSMG